jgi:hypothetical protein
MHLVPVFNGQNTTIVVVGSSFTPPVNGNSRRFLLLLMELSTADAISAVLAEMAAVNVVSYCQ